MNENKVFIDRRVNDDRRLEHDPCKDLSVDIYHRKRRKARERRHIHRSLIDDYMAYGIESKSETMINFLKN
ncbi:MAG: hypothetical protein V4732_11925 [Pseudomonadota bacterium]